jgi:hypothetical protein
MRKSCSKSIGAAGEIGFSRLPSFVLADYSESRMTLTFAINSFASDSSIYRSLLFRVSSFLDSLQFGSECYWCGHERNGCT